MGLVEQMHEFTKEIAVKAAPLQPLLKNNNVFLWTEDHRRAFNDVKEALVSLPVLAHYEPGRPLSLRTDAAQKEGLGFALFQQDTDEKWSRSCGQ